ncbi:MAG: hypothetical protein COX62_07280 [Deltaproteobacteria bacterium CG_4_10_14_0_2_um_filter_43_8]|nr:MAG: hypothetical protein COV43_08860 [Deltaproteobacteria bacterium CG11_big_fil_rev_8_21_14_0_20_42_23]PJA19102.1 MAG: hypothetical protein COX62_07280 [Deltaproteobacteria bacterium CG_4_10_14_0_2_um_filter_43_8]PJC64928.1 MAG: hypothetical protein CO021_01745 [Deltaproteobacteria bacterium CG_4_9_14_0_2_um_filter_42_21]
MAANTAGPLFVPVRTAREQVRSVAFHQDPLRAFRFLHEMKLPNHTARLSFPALTVTDKNERRNVHLKAERGEGNIDLELDVPSEDLSRDTSSSTNIYARAELRLARKGKFSLIQSVDLSFRRDAKGNVSSRIGFHGLEMTIYGAYFARYVNAHELLQEKIGNKWYGDLTPTGFFHAVNVLLPDELNLKWMDQRSHHHPLPQREQVGYWPLREDPQDILGTSLGVCCPDDRPYVFLNSGMKERRNGLQIDYDEGDATSGPEFTVRHFAQIHQRGVTPLYPGVARLFGFLLRFPKQ